MLNTKLCRDRQIFILSQYCAVDDAKASNLAVRPSILSARSNNYGNPAAPIPMLTYAINPFTGLYHQQPNFPFWPYPSLKPVSSVSDVEGDSAATSPGSRQQKIACGVGPASVPQRKTQSGNRIVGGSEATPNSWPFVVSLWTCNVPCNIET